MSIETSIALVTQADVLATWQDAGRVRSTHHGFGEGGAMDLHAAYWANRLLSRPPQAPTLEITMGLFALVFAEDCHIAITGADLGATLNGTAVQPWQTFGVKAGDALKFSAPVSGLRAYLAINARIELATAFDSVSTILRENLSGLLGRALKVGDSINGQVASQSIDARVVPQAFIPDYATPLTLQLIPGYQHTQFPQESIERLLTRHYEIQSSSGRMAYLLKGDPIEHAIDALASEGIAYGAVQIPADGRPVILLSDRQTMGGYPKPGCITRLSGSALAQRFAPTRVRFELVSRESAQRSYAEFLRFFSA